MVASFNASTTQVALGGHVNFTDGSFGDIVSWSWTFEGGTPTTSTQQNPSNITYNEVGDFDVTLTISDAEGNSETLTRTDYIHVRESYNMQNGTVETCNAMFYDNGGPDNNYNNNRDYTLTFLPGTEGSMISVNFTEFNTEAGYDYLYVFDGPSTNAPQIGRYDGSNGPGEVTANNEAGALTFRFTSDQGVNASGWVATVTCVGSYDPMGITVTADPELINEGDSSQLTAFVTGGDGNYTYLWEPAETLDNPAICCPIATPIQEETTYKVTVTDGQGNTVSGEVTVTIKDLSLVEDGFLPSVYPNPNNGTFTINARGEFTYRLFNSIGQQVMSGQGHDQTRIDASELDRGVYFLQLTAGGTQTEKVVIEK
jgi:PKD repeat protein